MQFPNNFFSTLITIILQIAQNGAVLFYNGNPGAGTLIGSLSPKAGTDQYGNTYPAGFRFSDGTVSITSTTTSIFGHDAAVTLWSTGGADESRAASIVAFSVPGGGATSLETLFAGPFNAGRTDGVAIAMFSSSDDGTSLPAGGIFEYYSPGGLQPTGSLTPAAWDFSGFNISSGSLTAVVPGTGTGPTVIATAETWHNASLNAGFANSGAPSANASYQLEGINGLRTRLRGQVTLTANQAANTAIFTLPVGYRPAFQQEYYAANTLSGSVSSRGAVFVDTSGNVRLAVAGLNGNVVQLNGIIELD